MPTSETNGLSEKYQSLCARQNGTGKGARTMIGVTKMYGTPLDPLVMEGRLGVGLRLLYASLHDLPLSDPRQPQETCVSLDAACLSDGRTGNIAKPFTGRIDSAAAYRKASGSSLSPHIDSNPHSDILSHGNRTDAAIAELVKGSEGVPFTVQTFVCTHSVCKGGAGFVFFTDPDDPHPASPPDEAYFEKTDKDFCKLNALGFAKFRWIRRVELQSGWGVSWVSSAIIHSNQAPYMDALDKQRYGFYVCRIPAGILSIEERAFNAKEKEKLAYAGRTTDHYPNLLHPSYGKLAPPFPRRRAALSTPASMCQQADRTTPTAARQRQ